MKPTRKTQPHRRKGRVMESGASLAAMLKGAGNLGNPQDVRRESVKRAGRGGPPAQRLGRAGLPPESGASSTLAPLLRALARLV